MIISAGKQMLAKGVMGLAIAGLLSVPSLAQTVSPDDVVALVDGVEITEDELAFAAEDMAQDLSSVPAEERRAFLVSILIDMKLMANAARNLDLNHTDVFERRLRYLEERALRRAYFASKIDQGIGEAEVRTAYDKFVAQQPAEEELHARHILLASEEDAQGVIIELNAGRDFEDVAREKSTGPSGPSGGDLGYFGRGRMVKEFEDAVFGLEVGQVSTPVQTQFGWHIIKLEERRQSAPPAFEQVAGQLRQQLLIEEFENSVNVLKEAAEIQIIDPELAEAFALEAN